MKWQLMFGCGCIAFYLTLIDVGFMASLSHSSGVKAFSKFYFCNGSF